jgi:hypothetical protein
MSQFALWEVSLEILTRLYRIPRRQSVSQIYGMCSPNLGLFVFDSLADESVTTLFVGSVSQNFDRFILDSR